MPHITPAARQLITEVVGFDPNVHAEGVGEPDGYGVLRSVRFIRSDWLGDAMDVLEDVRIESYTKENEASTYVTFVGDPRADFTYEFGIRAVAEILTSEDDEPDEPEDQDGDEGEPEQEKDDSEGHPR